MWKGWFEKKSAAFTLFWVLAYSEIFGTISSDRSARHDRQLHLHEDVRKLFLCSFQPRVD